MQKLLSVTQKVSADHILKKGDFASAFWREVLEIAEKIKTSDIHIEQVRFAGTKNHLRIRMRQSGELITVKESQNPDIVPILVQRFKEIAALETATTAICQDGAFYYAALGSRYRVAVAPEVSGEGIVCRVIRDGWIPKLSELNLQPEAEKDLLQACEQDQGIVLVTGPTGSGKSSTLQACLMHTDRLRWKVVAIEDPVERELEGVCHIPITQRVGWHNAIRTAMRYDPDYILIGEIRDRESALLALEAAQTGHLVFSTLHTNDAPGVVDRLIGLGVERHLIADNLTFVSAQRLEAKLCPNCRIKLPGGYYTRQIKGCDGCHGGVKGLTPILEYAIYPPPDSILLFNKVDFRKNHLKQTLKKECERLAQQGICDIERVNKYAD